MSSETSSRLKSLRTRLREATLQHEHDAVTAALRTADLDEDLREKIVLRATRLVQAIRERSDPGMMEVFLAEYGLSSDEGVALMCLAEA
ncbi:MAG: hypothetical protein ACR2RE_26540, partial [Geminicoccaceae bacterium]